MARETVAEQVKQVNERFYRAFESLDLPRMEQVWALEDGVTCIHPGWELMLGWPAVRESWRIIFQHTRRIQFHLSNLGVAVRGGIGLIVCQENIVTAIGEEVITSAVLATNIFERRGSDWRLIHHHGSQVLTPQSPPRGQALH